MVTPEMILQVRYELADTSIELPILVDAEYTYFLNKHNESIRRAAIDAAKTIMLKLSMSSGRKSIDILSLDNSGAATAYREALIAFIRNPDLNGLLSGVNPYAGGISKSDMNKNIAIPDNNYVKPPLSFSPNKRFEDLVFTPIEYF